MEEEERRMDGLFAQARKAEIDLQALGEQLTRRKVQLKEEIEAGGLPKPETTTLERVDL